MVAVGEGVALLGDEVSGVSVRRVRDRCGTRPQSGWQYGVAERKGSSSMVRRWHKRKVACRLLSWVSVWMT